MQRISYVMVSTPSMSCPRWRFFLNGIIVRRTIETVLLLGLALTLFPLKAAAHPHVWVTVSGEIVFNADHTVTEIRYVWLFDEAYSAYAVLGLDKNHDGAITKEELKDTSIINVEAFKDAQYFTFVTSENMNVNFRGASDYSLAYENGRLSLSFVLHLQTPIAAGHDFDIKIYDPTFFVSLTLSGDLNTIKAIDIPDNCSIKITRPESLVDAQRAISDQIFLAMDGNSTYGARYANEARVSCTNNK